MKRNPLVWAISLGILVVSLAVAYYLVVFIPKQEEIKNSRIEDQVRQEQKAEQKKEEDYRLCVLKADLDYSSWWEAECESQDLGEDCRLPKYNADALNASREKAKDRCIELYK